MHVGDYSWKPRNEKDRSGHFLQVASLHSMYIQTDCQSLLAALDEFADPPRAQMGWDEILDLHRLFDSSASLEICAEVYAQHQPSEHLRTPLRRVGLADVDSVAEDERLELVDAIRQKSPQNRWVRFLYDGVCRGQFGGSEPPLSQLEICVRAVHHEWMHRAGHPGSLQLSLLQQEWDDSVWRAPYGNFLAAVMHER